MKTLLCVSLVLLCFIGVSCGGAEVKAAHDSFLAAYQAAIADGIIDPTEAAQLKTLGQAFIDAAKEHGGGFDWQEFLYTTLGAATTAIFGVNFMRNRSLPGANRIKTVEPTA
jgi:hypothetical protein